jgi:flavin reductase (DIM6/NTAB) family NADH-FMN oxidoreductase RutF/rubredoxin
MDSTALYKISYGLYVVGTKIDGKYAGCVVDAFIQSTSSPVPTVILCSILANQTNAAIKQTGEFTISVLSTDTDPFIIGNFGFQSGRKADKWSNVPHKTVDGLPVLEKAVSYLRCRVTDQKELSTHTAFFCEVTDAWLGEGEPLIFGDYQKAMKAKTLAAFNAFKESGKAPVFSSEAAPAAPAPAVTIAPTAEKAEKWVCSVCGYVYDGEIPFEQLPDSWTCPLCGQPKSVFEKKAV